MTVEKTWSLNPLFGEGCVLQSGMPANVWGVGEPDRRIEVRVHGTAATATVGDDGAWRVQLDPLEPGGPYRLEVRVDGGDEPVIAHDVYAGEVFICAGQSNIDRKSVV